MGNEGLLPICAVGDRLGVHGLPKPRPQRPRPGLFSVHSGGLSQKDSVTRFGLQ